MTRVLHVTDVFRDFYAGRTIDQWYLDRGSMVHLACDLLDGALGLDWSTLDPRIEGYVRAWARCKRETECVVIASERPVSGPGWKGTLDKVVSPPNGKREVWDLKCGQPEPWHGLQLAAYEVGHRGRTGTKPYKRRGIYLRADGTYQMVEYPGKDDYRTFLALLTREYWMISHGLRDWPALREGEEA